MAHLHNVTIQQNLTTVTCLNCGWFSSEEEEPSAKDLLTIIQKQAQINDIC